MVVITSGYDLPHPATLIEWMKRYVPGLVSVVQPERVVYVSCNLDFFTIFKYNEEGQEYVNNNRS